MWAPVHQAGPGRWLLDASKVQAGRQQRRVQARPTHHTPQSCTHHMPCCGACGRVAGWRAAAARWQGEEGRPAAHHTAGRYWPSSSSSPSLGFFGFVIWPMPHWPCAASRTQQQRTAPSLAVGGGSQRRRAVHASWRMITMQDHHHAGA